MIDLTRGTRGRSLFAVLLVSLLAFPAIALAGDDDDGDNDDRFGAWLHAGTPEDFSEDVLARFGHLEHEDDREDIDEFDLSGVDATDFWEADEDVHLSIEQLMAEPHVIVVRARNDVSSAVIAVGLVDGEVNERGELTIVLAPVDDSGFAGMAFLEPDDDDDDETDIDIVIWEGAPLELGTPVA